MSKINYKKKKVFSIILLFITVILAFLILFILFAPDAKPPARKEPIRPTKDLLKNQIECPGIEECTTRISFDKSFKSLTIESLIDNTGLDISQVYFDNPESLLQFSTIENKRLIYNSSSRYNVLMCAICSNSKEQLENAIEKYNTGKDNFEIVNNIVDLADNQTICVIYPRKAK